MKRGPMPHFNMMYELFKTKDITAKDLEKYKFCIFCNDVLKDEVEVEKVINYIPRDTQIWDYCTVCKQAVYPKWYEIDDGDVYVCTEATYSDYYPRKKLNL